MAQVAPLPWYHKLVWYSIWTICKVLLIVCYRMRVRGEQNIPGTGGVLYVCNHQSFLDPVIIGVATHRRRIRPMARSSLFTNRFFGWLIRTLGAFPVERGAADLTAMRTSVELLKQGTVMLVFPEGTRTSDGKTAEFHSGAFMLIKRARPIVIPVAIEGAFDAWPRSRSRPKLFGRVGIMFGEPLDPRALMEFGPDTAMNMLHEKVEKMRLDLAKQL